MKTWREECGLFGVWNHEEAARLSYLGLYAMQHRGQESAGIVSLYRGEHLVHRGLGLVADVFKDPELKELKGRSSIGHVRYSTTGENRLINAQPMAADLLHGPVALAHNGNLVNGQKLRKKLQVQGSIFQGTNDTECVLHLISHVPSGHFLTSIKSILPQLEGAFSFIFLSHREMVVVRDQYGFRPLVLGRKKNDLGDWAWVVASETCAFDLIGAEFLREIEPGEIFWVDEHGTYSEKWTQSSRLAQCIFEHVYFSRPDSVVFGRSVYDSRKRFGKWLAKEEKDFGADVVVPVPDSGVPAAIGYAAESRIPFEFGIIRNHYVGRTFIQPHQSVRDIGVKIKLNPQTAVLSGKKVVVVDDSLVRGTTSQKIIRLIRQAGAKEIRMRIASPPTIGPCYYGVDTPQKSQLIAANQTLEEIRSFIGADSLSYLSMEGLLSSMDESLQQKSFCAACFNGEYPT